MQTVNLADAKGRHCHHPLWNKMTKVLTIILKCSAHSYKVLTDEMSIQNVRWKVTRTLSVTDVFVLDFIATEFTPVLYKLSNSLLNMPGRS